MATKDDSVPIGQREFHSHPSLSFSLLQTKMDILSFIQNTGMANFSPCTKLFFKVVDPD
jgi:hypothetical protein